MPGDPNIVLENPYLYEIPPAMTPESYLIRIKVESPDYLFQLLKARYDEFINYELELLNETSKTIKDP